MFRVDYGKPYVLKHPWALASAAQVSFRKALKIGSVMKASADPSCPRAICSGQGLSLTSETGIAPHGAGARDASAGIVRAVRQRDRVVIEEVLVEPQEGKSKFKSESQHLTSRSRTGRAEGLNRYFSTD